MYRLSEKVAEYLLKHTTVPYKMQDNGVGVSDSIYAMGLSFEYVLECPYPVFINGGKEFEPEVVGYWLYKRGELKPVIEPIPIPRINVDINVTDPMEELDVSDCCVMVPSVIEKLTCTATINTVDDLLKKEPSISKYLLKGGKND